MHLSGQLSDWSINDLLQIMQVTKKTGSLDIDGERRGRIHFREGTVTGAELAGAEGRYVGSDRGAVTDILYVLSAVESGSFALGEADGPETRGWTVEEVLAEVEVLRSLEGEVVDAGLFEAGGICIASEITEPVTISPEDWSVVASLVRPFTFDQIEAKLGRGGAVRIFHTLNRMGVVETIEPGEEDESGWLDQLAEGISKDTGQPVGQAPASPDAGRGAHLSDTEDEPEIAPVDVEPVKLRGVSAPASTTLTAGVFDEIRRLRGTVGED